MSLKKIIDTKYPIIKVITVFFTGTELQAPYEKKLYESRITDLQKEIDRLHSLLEKTLTK
jgi:hypothetical protein